jgi:Copper type II ascorbate-dependent monooxygenase, C-terminal domain
MTRMAKRRQPNSKTVRLSTMSQFSTWPLFAVATLLFLSGATAISFSSAGTQEKGSSPPPTFYRDVLPILEQRCQSCHRAGGIAPTTFETYEETKPFASAIRLAVQNRSMPPWFADPRVGRFSNDPSLTAEQISVLAAWAEAKAPAGDSSNAPLPKQWNEGWSIPQPDLILRMPRAVPLPASGDIEYTYEIVPTQFREDRWAQMAEILPALRANVHHAVVYIRPPDSNWLRHAPVGVPFTASTLSDLEDRRGAHWTDTDILLVYAPGSSPDMWPANMAKFIPAGSDLVFQMHYTSNGHAGQDRSSIGLVFSKYAPEQRVLTLQLTNDHFVIPPDSPDYRVEARGTLPNDATLLSFFPHMHLRGKRFEYNIIRPNSSAERQPTYEIEPLLRVNYHFHWQMSYHLATPLPLKAGTELQAVAWYDNSKQNPHNPDPDAEVRWGEQTYDEMMVGFFDVAVPASVDKPRYFIRTKENQHPR